MYTPSLADTRGLTELNAYKKTVGVGDVWREKHPAANTYTYSSPNNLIHARLERFYISPSQPLVGPQDYHWWSTSRPICATPMASSSEGLEVAGTLYTLQFQVLCQKWLYLSS